MDDEYSYWSRARARIWEAYRDCPPFKEMAEAAARSGSDLEMPREQFERQLNQLYEAYSSFLHGTNSGSETSKWRHWYNRFRDARLGKKWGKPELQAEMLSDAAYEYLNGALRVSRMDRALLDSLIAQETFAFIDRRAGAGAFLMQFGCFGFAVAGSLAWQIFFGTVSWHRLAIASAIVAGILGIGFFWPKRGVLSLHLAMRDTYNLLSGSVVSVPELRRSVERAREKGVVWPPELYAVLDDVEARTRTV